MKRLGAEVGKGNFGRCFRFHSLSFPTHQPLSEAEPCKNWSRFSDKFELIYPYSDSSPSSRQVQFENSSFWSRPAPVFGTHGSCFAPPPGTSCWRRPQFGLSQFVNGAVDMSHPYNKLKAWWSSRGIGFLLFHLILSWHLNKKVRKPKRPDICA